MISVIIMSTSALCRRMLEIKREPRLSFALFSRALTHPGFSFSSPSCRWEAVQVHVGQLRLAFRSFRWADAPLPEAHGRQALPVRRLLALLFPIWPLGPAHEKTPELAAFGNAPQTHKHCLNTRKALTPSPTTTLLQAAWCRATLTGTTAPHGAAIMC